MKAQEDKNDPTATIPITPKLIRRVWSHLGGKASKGVTSPAKRRAARENGKKGGRPKRPQMELKLT